MPRSSSLSFSPEIRAKCKGRISVAAEKDDSSAGLDSYDDESKEGLAEKLAAAEAEAKALREELAARRAEKRGDLSKLRPDPPAKRIDGTGFRETLFESPGRRTGREEQQMSKWGLSEAEMFLSKGVATGGMGLQGAAYDENANKIVTKRLLIGLAITAVTIGLAVLKLPTLLVRPSKPLFFYLVPVLRLQNALRALAQEDTATDVALVKDELKAAVGQQGGLKDNLLSAAALLEGKASDEATNLAFSILEYLDQADYSRYFEYRGTPSALQQEEFLKFSLQSLKATLAKLEEFLAFMPQESREAAQTQLGAFGN